MCWIAPEIPHAMIQVRSYSLTSLSYLSVLSDPSCINVCSGGGDFSAQQICYLLQFLVEICGTDSSTAGYQNLSVCDINSLLRFLDYFLDGYVHIFMV